MLSMKKIDLIRKYKFDLDMPTRVISYKLDVSPTSVYKYTKMTDFNQSLQKPRKKRHRKVEKYEPLIKEWLLEDKTRHYKQRHTAKRVYDRLKEMFDDFDLSYSSIATAYRKIRSEVYYTHKEYAPLRYLPGEAQCDLGNCTFVENEIEYKGCYIVLSFPYSNIAFVLIFPPRSEDENYIVYPHFWLPEDTLELRCRRDHVLYDVWKKQGYINTTEGNVIHYGFIEKYINDLNKLYNIKEIAVDRWNATQVIQNLEDDGFTMVPFGQGYKDMSPPSKELYKLLMEGKITHGGNPVLKWMAGNIVMHQDPAGNIKPDKEKSVEKIDGIVATIMALDRCIRNKDTSSVYDNRGILVI